MMMMMMMNTPLTSASGKPAMTPRLGSQLGHAICRVVSASRPEKNGAFHPPKVGVNPFTISITNCEQIWIQYMIVYDNSSLVWDNSTIDYIVYNYHYDSLKMGGKISKISMEFSWSNKWDEHPQPAMDLFDNAQLRENFRWIPLRNCDKFLWKMPRWCMIRISKSLVFLV